MFLIIKKYIKNKELNSSNLLSISSENKETQNVNITNYINDTKEKRPKIIDISYGHQFFKKQLKLNKKSALEVGQVSEHYSYGLGDIDKYFRERNKEILSKGRGNGLWLWKPYIINKTMIEKLEEGDFLIYTDASIIFMNSYYLLIYFFKENKAEMWMNRLTLKERK